MTVFFTLSRKRTFQKDTTKSTIRACIFPLLLFYLTSCASQQSQVVTVKKRTETNTDSSLLSTNSSGQIAADDVKTAPLSTINNPDSLLTKGITNTAENPTEKFEFNEDLSFEERAIKVAETYLGVRYRYAGTSIAGVDCSGLINLVFKQLDKSIPRTSGGIMNITDPVLRDQVMPGDLVFFTTGRNRSRVSHVGMVTRVLSGDLEFIHSSASQGVIKSKLSEQYWTRAFLRAGRLVL